ncbi:chemotaxis protein CheR [Betaproteobacteria bacterium GR16-43]|nr:chemotaxis protein CheR [Betaproteobacteria bacterium GR16-43]
MATEEREFAYARADFARVRQLIHQRAGIALAEGKAEMVYSRVAKRVRALGFATFADYLSILDDDQHPEWEHFVNSLTTNQTDFFREAHHFPILAAHAKALGRELRIWSAASSTGEEPYSIAITLCEAFGTFEPPVRIVATDLDSKVLATGRDGVYPMERVTTVDDERLRRFFLKGKGSRAGHARVRDELRSLVEFRPINLRDTRWDVEGPFDAIFCRNVLIYFDKATQRGVLERLSRRLAPDGLYFAGHSESLLHASDLFIPRGRTVYGKAKGAA